ncbi:hypothetical protein LWI29_030088 [Acer saccharum]|uniref:Uncharacterized protein n=1 Tax=Acer saccharum TaxID=4024 RepID=A0AA39VJI3_ACESA|nr:hypothetical protein LWI29_030088 [Acer saccharum]
MDSLANSNHFNIEISEMKKPHSLDYCDTNIDVDVDRNLTDYLPSNQAIIESTKIETSQSLDFCDTNIDADIDLNLADSLPSNLELTTLEGHQQQGIDEPITTILPNPPSMPSSAMPSLMNNDNALQHNDLNTTSAASRPIRDRHPPSYLKDYVAVAMNHSSSSLPRTPTNLSVVTALPPFHCTTTSLYSLYYWD